VKKISKLLTNNLFILKIILQPVQAGKQVFNITQR